MRTKIFTLLLIATCAAPALSQEPLVLAPTEPVAGMSQVEWSRAWWQWAGSFERDKSPVGDRTGALCAAGQSGPVWFLAGTYGTQRTVRTCKVPRDKHIFFPLINYVAMPGRAETTCPSVTAQAAILTRDASALVLDIDGTRVPNLAMHRLATTQCFDMGARTASGTRVFPSASNGYYAMLRPLRPGRHTINFGGVLPNMAQAVTYTLEVE